ncbi:MAG: DUF4198 domain-containing protein [Planctomycetes bacterium]|nr:DUF4198 domain-containing protein [Planctomycetota bacterium]
MNFSRSVLQRLAFSIFAAGLSFANVGCGKSASTEVSVTGHVTLNGKPAAGATVVFHPVNPGKDAVRPTGRVDEKGDFQVAIPKSEDGTTGEYRVTVTQFVSTATKRTAEGESSPLWNQIPGKYSKVETTPVSTIVKPEGTETVSIEIKAPNTRQ